LVLERELADKLEESSVQEPQCIRL